MKRYITVSISILLLIGMLPVTALSQAAHHSIPYLVMQRATGQTSPDSAFIVNPFRPPVWIGEANYEGDSYGASVTSAGDVNGDGYADVVIGAPYYMNGQNMEGRAYAYYGSPSGLVLSPAWTFENNIEKCELGQKTASAGDVNGDGFDDVLVGSEYCPTTSQPEHREGVVYLFFGSSTGLSPDYDWMLEGETSDASLGWSLASAGDVNADGFDDVIIGAPWGDNPEGNEGLVYVFYGSATGLAATADWSAESNIWWTGFGTWVDSAGDIDGDGYDDVIIGHPGWSSPENGEGRAYVYLGSATGLEATASWTFENSHIDSELGKTVAGVGDVNGDGYDDVMVGGTKYANPDPFEGVAYLFLGSNSGLSLTPDWSHEGNQAYSQYSWALEPAGDVNNDGYDDVLIGAPWYTDGEEAEGMAFLYFGSPAGLRAEPVFTQGGDQIQARLGWYAASAGDVNGDKLDDLILGARNYSHPEGGEGVAFVYLGREDAAARILLPVVVR